MAVLFRPPCLNFGRNLSGAMRYSRAFLVVLLYLSDKYQYYYFVRCFSGFLWQHLFWAFNWAYKIKSFIFDIQHLKNIYNCINIMFYQFQSFNEMTILCYTVTKRFTCLWLCGTCICTFFMESVVSLINSQSSLGAVVPYFLLNDSYAPVTWHPHVRINML